MQNNRIESERQRSSSQGKAYYQCPSRQIIFDDIKTRLLSGHGVLSLYGEQGIGKSFMLQELTTVLSEQVTFISLPSRNQTFQSLITELCDDLGLTSGKEIILVSLQSIYKFLELNKQANQRFVVVIDDAQHLTRGIIEKLLLLSVPPTDKSAPLQLLFSSDIEITSMLEDSKHPHVKNTTFFSYQLQRLNPSETLDLIRHQLSIAEFKYLDLFTPAAISNIVDLSSGVPIRVKSICETALTAIGAPEQPRITEKLIHYVARELSLVPVDSIPDITDEDIRCIQPETLQESPVMTTERMLTIAQSEDYDTIEGQSNKAASESGLLSQTIEKITDQTEHSHDNTIADAQPDVEKDRVTSIQNSEPKLRLTWGIAALAILTVILFAYKSLRSGPESGQNSVVVTDADKTLISQADQPSQIQPGKGLNQSRSDSPQQGSTQRRQTTTSQPSHDSGTTQPGSSARAFIAAMEASGQTINLNLINDQALMLSKQNQPVDAYLLDFYAARRGHAEAAFRLAQLSDPATQSQRNGRSEFAKADITQARKWYEQARLAGHPKAEQFLNQMRKQLRDKADTGDEYAQRLMLQFIETQ
ncbi:MAG: AAA family ATPase [Gammaproteobacteria bacterium]|nr:AAA family ATPase [Gammaproteobacteria bacterium]